MKLHRVHIKNYRSIRDITIDFDPSCRVLVGINESGKSNILRALRLLGDNYKPASADDVREALPNENPVTESFVWFAFKLEKAEADQVYDTVSQLVISADVSSKIVGDRGRTQSLKELCASRDEVLYHHAQYWAFDNRAKLFPGWKKPASNSPQDNAFEHNGHSYQLSKSKLIRAKDFPDIPLDIWKMHALMIYCRSSVAQFCKVHKTNDQNPYFGNTMKQTFYLTLQQSLSYTKILNPAYH